MARAKRITAQEVKRRMDGGQPVSFIDARSGSAWAQSDVKLPGARRRSLEKYLAGLPRDRMIVAYCT